MDPSVFVTATHLVRGPPNQNEVIRSPICLDTCLGVSRPDAPGDLGRGRQTDGSRVRSMVYQKIIPAKSRDMTSVPSDPSRADFGLHSGLPGGPPRSPRGAVTDPRRISQMHLVPPRLDQGLDRGTGNPTQKN